MRGGSAMRSEGSGQSRKIVVEEGDHQRRLNRRLKREAEFEKGGVLICTERGKCYTKPKTASDRRGDEG